MKGSLQLLPVALLGAAFAFSAAGQVAISAKSGMIHYTEGKVLLGDKQVVQTGTEFPAMKEGEILRTEEGRAEVLLTPGVFLRVWENSAVKMISDRLIDTRLEVLSGSVILECAEINKDQNISLVVKEAQVTFRKHGVYRIDADQNLVRVYDGEAVVAKAGQSVVLKDGRQTLISAVFSSEKFDNKIGDSFFRWAARRAEYIAAANMSAARRLSSSGYGFTSGAGSWLWNSYFGMFTFLPGTGFYRSFFGPFLYSPGAFYYSNPRPYYGGGHYGGGSALSHDTPTYNSSYGYSTVGSRSSPSYANSTAPSAPASAPAPAARSGDGATGRGGTGHGR